MVSPHEENLDKIIRRYRKVNLPPKEQIVYDVGYLVGLVLLLHEALHVAKGSPYIKEPL